MTASSETNRVSPIGRREVREGLRDGLAGLARGHDAAERELGVPCDESQELAGDVARAAEHDGRDLGRLAHAGAFAVREPRPMLACSRSPSSAELVIAFNAATFERCRMMSMPT